MLKRAALVVVVVLIAYVGITFAQVWRASTWDQTRPVDAVVVLGAAQYNGRPSPVFERRSIGRTTSGLAASDAGSC